jgi:hypothetical protein
MLAVCCVLANGMYIHEKPTKIIPELFIIHPTRQNTTPMTLKCVELYIKLRER